MTTEVGDGPWEPGIGETGKWNEEDYYRESVTVDRFHIGQGYDDEPAKPIECTKCAGKTFHVAQGRYFTAIRCVNCRWEICFHDG